MYRERLPAPEPQLQALQCGTPAVPPRFGWNQGLPQRKIEVHRPGTEPTGLAYGVRGSREVQPGGKVVRWRGQRMFPAHICPEYLRLVHRLVRPAVNQLGWAVGGQQEEGHALQGGFHNTR